MHHAAIHRSLRLITALLTLSPPVLADDCPTPARHGAVRLGLGASAQSLLGVPVYGARFEAGFGGAGRHGSGFATVDWLPARTEHGLLILAAHLGGVGFWHFRGGRYGLGGRVGLYHVVAVTQGGDLDLLSLTVRLPVEFDVAENLHFGIEAETGTNDLWAATAGLGWQW
jgi:hypothetical protein